MSDRALPKKTLLLWQIRVVMLTIALIAIMIYYAETMPFLNSVAVIVGILALVAVVWYLPKFFATYEIKLKGEAIIVNYGIFIKISHIMPYSRLIYAQSFSTPLARLFGVTALSLKAARSHVIIPEVNIDDAMKVIKSLTKEVRHDQND